jgi:hypothetical protein
MKLANFPEADGTVSVAFMWLAAALVATISLAYTGYEFGLSNNAFHVPFVLSLDRLPQFHADEFYSTLKFFTSAVWFVVRPLTTEHNVETVFFSLHVLSRVAAVYAALHLARTLGLADRLGLALVALGLVVSPHLLASYVGGHDFFNEYFTHTALTWPFLLMALADCEAQRFQRAAFFAGLVFLINAFVGVWLSVALALGAALNWRQHQRHDGWRLPAIFLLVCAPVLLWIRLAISGGPTGQDFDFRNYLGAYFGGHFVIDWTDVPRLLEAAAIFAATIWCALELGKQRLAWTLGGFVGIVVAGIVLPYFTNNRLIFNLHLLRAAGVPQFLFPLLVLVIAWRRWYGTTWIERMSAVLIGVSVINGMSALVAVAGLALPMFRVPDRSRFGAAILFAALAAGLGMVVGRAGQLGAGQFVGLYCASAILLLDPESRNSLRGLVRVLVVFVLLGISIGSALELHEGLARYRNVAAVLVVWICLLCNNRQWILAPRLVKGFSTVLIALLAIQAAGVAVTIMKRDSALRADEATRQDYFALIDWLKDQPFRGPLLVPMELKDGKVTDNLLFRYNLQLFSRQSVWVDWKQGAAVMWQPAFHGVWRPRYEAVKRLTTPNDYYRYASEHHIRWMLLNDGDTVPAAVCPAGDKMPSFSRGRYRVCVLD